MDCSASGTGPEARGGANPVEALTLSYQCAAQTPSVARVPGAQDSMAGSNGTSNAWQRARSMPSGFSSTSRASITGGGVPCTSATFAGPVTRYASSEHAERGFCPTCGTHLFFNPIGKPVYGIPLGLFDDPAQLPFAAEFFIDEKPPTYSFANDTKKLTGAEFIAKFRG